MFSEFPDALALHLRHLHSVPLEGLASADGPTFARLLATARDATRVTAATGDAEAEARAEHWAGALEGTRQPHTHEVPRSGRLKEALNMVQQREVPSPRTVPTPTPSRRPCHRRLSAPCRPHARARWLARPTCSC